MKYREGFVSNSSSTSFCIIGKSFQNNEFENKCSGVNINQIGLDEHSNQYGDETYLGISAERWAELDINYSELVKLVEDKLRSLGFETSGIGVNTDGWYDG